jgi:AraC-like DNA-binding protein
MSNTFSTLSGWMIPLSRVMAKGNLDLAEAFSACEIEPAIIKDQESRIAAEKIAVLLNYCKNKLGRKDLSILVAREFHPGMFHALGYAMMSSSCLKDALSCIAQYKRVVSDSCSLALIEVADELIFEMTIQIYEDTGRNVLDRQMTETFLATIVQLSRGLVSFDFNPKRLILSFPQPDFDTSYLNEFCKCEVEFNASKSALVFDLKQANTELIGGNPLITQVHYKMLDEFLSRIDKDDLTYVIKNKIYQVLPLGAPSQIDIARQLGISLRNLQRKLHDKDTSYKEILEQTRKKLTMDYIKQRHLSLSEIGYLVGFSSVGNFNRAFKRWTSITPGEYRNQHFDQ